MLKKNQSIEEARGCYCTVFWFHHWPRVNWPKKKILLYREHLLQCDDYCLFSILFPSFSCQIFINKIFHWSNVSFIYLSLICWNCWIVKFLSSIKVFERESKWQKLVAYVQKEWKRNYWLMKWRSEWLTNQLIYCYYFKY